MKNGRHFRTQLAEKRLKLDSSSLYYEVAPTGPRPARNVGTSSHVHVLNCTRTPIEYRNLELYTCHVSCHVYREARDTHTTNRVSVETENQDARALHLHRATRCTFRSHISRILNRAARAARWSASSILSCASRHVKLTQPLHAKSQDSRLRRRDAKVQLRGRAAGCGVNLRHECPSCSRSAGAARVPARAMCERAACPSLGWSSEQQATSRWRFARTRAHPPWSWARASAPP